MLDFTQLLQGPFATQMLGDFGADIIKIEKLGSGDLFRGITFFNEWIGGSESPCYLAWNRNKRSLAIDLKKPAGKEIIHRLVRQCDVVVENFRPGVLDRLGYGYEELSQLNPRLIYCSSSGWGDDGPYVSRPGQDLLVQGMAGVAMATGRDDQPPVPLGIGLSDQLGAFHIVYGVLTALYWREKSGRGQRIGVNLFSSTLAIQAQDFVTELNLGRRLERPNSGIGHPGMPAPFGIYPTKDGFISIAMNPFVTLVRILADPSLLEFNDPQILFDRRDEVWTRISAVTRTRPTADWLREMLAVDLWVAEVKERTALVDDPQARHLGAFTTFDHPKAGTVRTVNIPLTLSETPGEIERPPPLVGQHSREILGELGYQSDEITALFEAGIISMEMDSRPAPAPQ